jgi:hypothetical protein
MNELHAAISFNNNGVHCLEANNVSEAMQAFQNSILAIKHASQVLPSKFHNPMKQFQELPTGMLSVKETMCPIYFGKSVSGLQNALYYTFDRAIILRPPSPQMIDDEIESYIHFTTMVVLFNLALTTHVSAIKYGRSYALEHAIKLYFLVETMTNDVFDDGNIGDLMKWLTMNNAASLHFELCDYENFAIDLQYLQKLFNDDANVERFTTILFETEELTELTLNIFYFNAPIAAHAA